MAKKDKDIDVDLPADADGKEIHIHIHIHQDEKPAIVVAPQPVPVYPWYVQPAAPTWQPWYTIMYKTNTVTANSGAGVTLWNTTTTGNLPQDT